MPASESCLEQAWAQAPGKRRGSPQGVMDRNKSTHHDRTVALGPRIKSLLGRSVTFHNGFEFEISQPKLIRVIARFPDLTNLTWVHPVLWSCS
eukprot:208265-Rhodomonas_salina.2